MIMSELTIINSKKTTYIEILRIIAILLVIFNHTLNYGYMHFTTYEVGSAPYWFFMPFSVMTGINTPIFLMISGMLLLGKQEETFSYVLKKRIPKYLVALFLYSLFYYLCDIEFRLNDFSCKDFLTGLYSGTISVPAWFLYLYLAFLLILPVLRKVARNMNGKEFLYIAVIYLVFQALLPILQFLIGGEQLTVNTDIRPLPILYMAFICPVTGYYLGVVLKEIKSKQLFIFFFLFVLSVLLTCFMTHYMISTTNRTDPVSIEYFYETTRVFRAAFIFLLIRKVFEGKEIPNSINNLILLAGSSVFGIYLLEQFFRVILFSIYIKLSSVIPCFLAVLVYVLSVFIFCLITVLLFKLPFFLIRTQSLGKRKHR